MVQQASEMLVVEVNRDRFTKKKKTIYAHFAPTKIEDKI